MPNVVLCGIFSLDFNHKLPLFLVGHWMSGQSKVLSVSPSWWPTNLILLRLIERAVLSLWFVVIAIFVTFTAFIHIDLMAGMQKNWLMYQSHNLPPVNVGGQKLPFYRMIIRSLTSSCGLFKPNTLKHLRTVHFTNWTTSQAWKGCVLIKCRRLIYHMVGLDYTCDEKIRNTILSYFLKNKTKMNFIFKICLRQKLTIIKTSFNESMSMKQERYQW